MPNVYVNASGTNYAAKEIFVNASGTWLPVKEVWVNASGTWQKSFPESSGTANYTTAGSYSWTVPNGVYSINVSLISGGGGGSGGGGWSNCAGNNGDAYTGGGGGSGGFIRNQTLAVTPGETLGIVVGAGGYAGTYKYVPGAQGQTSNINRGGTSIIFATGGQGGQPGPNCGSGAGGAGGSPAGVAGQSYTTCGNQAVGGDNGTGFGYGGTASGCGSANGQAGVAGVVIFSW